MEDKILYISESRSGKNKLVEDVLYIKLLEGHKIRIKKATGARMKIETKSDGKKTVVRFEVNDHITQVECKEYDEVQSQLLAVSIGKSAGLTPEEYKDLYEAQS